MQKLLLIQPPGKVEKLYSSFSSAGSELPPLGLGYLAAVLLKEKFNTKIIDCLKENLTIEEAAKRIFKENPDYVCITTYTIFMEEVTNLIKILKQSNRSIKIITGGGHITALPYQTMERYTEIDYGVISEGEVTLVELIKTLQNNGDLSKVKGIIFRKNNEIIQTEVREFIKELDILPQPAFELYNNLTSYIPAADSINRYPVTSLIASRGCPGKCIFCNLTMFGNKTRYHSPDYIVDMIKYLQKKYRIKEIFFQDDTFFVNKRIVQELCEKILKENIDLTFACYGRVDMVDYELLKLMKRAGCWQISYGIETADQKILDFTKKGITVSQSIEAVNLTKKAKIRVKGLFMLGNFLETKDSINKTIKLIKELPLDDFHMTYFTPYPGSLSYEIAENYGRFDKKWSNLTFFSPTFIPKDLTKEELVDYYKKIYRMFYLRLPIIFYYLTKLRNRIFFMKLIKAFLSFIKGII